MSDDLYQATILEHARRAHPIPEAAERRAAKDNPFCGDAVEIAVHLDERGFITAIGYHADGCAIAKASASMMCAAVAGRDAAGVAALRAGLDRLLAGEAVELPADLGALAGVARYPVRRKCATLAWDALGATLRP
jgi:nitrogen fixation NifU-like protein